jgi:hypothetical protein
LFSKLKSRARGCHVQTLDSVQKAVTDAIETLSEADFQSWYAAWKIRWAKRVAPERSYFEGDNVDFVQSESHCFDNTPRTCGFVRIFRTDYGLDRIQGILVLRMSLVIVCHK